MVKTVYYHIKRLEQIVSANPNSVVGRDILQLVQSNELEKARTLYFNEGDKVTQYAGMKEAIEAVLGCRIHGIINCTRWLCTRTRGNVFWDHENTL